MHNLYVDRWHLWLIIIFASIMCVLALASIIKSVSFLMRNDPEIKITQQGLLFRGVGFVPWSAIDTIRIGFSDGWQDFDEYIQIKLKHNHGCALSSQTSFFQCNRFTVPDTIHVRYAVKSYNNEIYSLFKKYAPDRVK